MKKVVFALALCATPAFADGNGADVLPFTTPGGQISGAVTIDGNGDATVAGQIQGVPFVGLSKAHKGSDGEWVFDILLSDADTLIKKKSWVPLSFRWWGTKEDSDDGDDSDDSVGAIEVKSQTGMGKGSVQLSG